MAEQGDNASRTEDASPRKLEEARKEGDVPKSMELSQVFALSGAFAAVAYHLADSLRPFIAHPETIELQGAAGQAVAWQVTMAASPVLFTVLGATMLAGVGGNVIQHG